MLKQSQVIFFTAYGIEIPEQGLGSELFFFFWTTIKTKLKWKWSKIIEQRIKQLTNNNEYWRINNNNEYE
jgi:hypothetical protein